MSSPLQDILSGVFPKKIQYKQFLKFYKSLEFFLFQVYFQYYVFDKIYKSMLWNFQYYVFKILQFPRILLIFMCTESFTNPLLFLQYQKWITSDFQSKNYALPQVHMHFINKKSRGEQIKG